MSGLGVLALFATACTHNPSNTGGSASQGGSGSQTGSSSTPSAPPLSSVPADLVGTWAPFSSSIGYDAGGGGTTEGGNDSLTLSSDGHWQYGTDTGTWSTRAITSADWTTWRVQAYGPTDALVLSNWNGGTASGPIETSNGMPDFVWVIYHVTSPSPALIELRFNR